jgi:hypothetical protein
MNQVFGWENDGSTKVKIPHVQQSWGLNRQRFAGSNQSPILTHWMSELNLDILE